MSAAKHTPGPWRLLVDPWPDDPFGFALYSIRALPAPPESCGDAVTIFTDRPHRSNCFTPFPSQETVAANARLMTAAPELLEEAKRTADEIEEAIRVLIDDESVGTALILQQRLNALRVVMAKATGEAE